MSILEDLPAGLVDEDTACFLCGRPIDTGVCWDGVGGRAVSGSVLAPAFLVCWHRECFWPFVERVAVDLYVLSRRERVA